MDWWPVTRDVSLYILAIILLVTMTWDGLIFWYEGLVLFIAYFVYFSVMFQNDRISKVVRRWTSNFRNGDNLKNNIKVVEGMDSNIYYIDEPTKKYVEHQETTEVKKEKEEEKEEEGKLHIKVFKISKLKSAF